MDEIRKEVLDDPEKIIGRCISSRTDDESCCEPESTITKEYLANE